MDDKPYAWHLPSSWIRPGSNTASTTQAGKREKGELLVPSASNLGWEKGMLTTTTIIHTEKEEEPMGKRLAFQQRQPDSTHPDITRISSADLAGDNRWGKTSMPSSRFWRRRTA